MIYVARGPSTAKGTFGVWYVDSTPTCLTCELPWLDNQPGVSCIPPGVYHCIRHISAKFPLGNTWEITNVLGRTGILIHNANDIAQLEGCICVGSSLGKVSGLPAVLNSVATLAQLNDELLEGFDITILASPLLSIAA
jgi:hypothetical protein